MHVPLLHSKYPGLTLSPLVVDDAADMAELLNDEETVKYLIGPPYPITIEQVKEYIFVRPMFNGHHLAWAIRHDGRLIGEVGLDYKEAPWVFELGYSLSRHYWNNGIMNLAVKSYLDMMIKLISVEEDITIVAGYIADNLASGRILKNCGFVEVGYEEKMKNGKKMHGVTMSRIIPGKGQTSDVDFS